MELYVHPGMTSLRSPTLMEQLRGCVGKARQEGRYALVRKGLFLISNLYYQQGDFHNALERIIKAEEAGRSADPATMIRAVADTAKCFGMVDQKIDRAESLALEAQELAEEMDLENTVYEIPLALALVNHHRGQYDRAIQQYRQALQLIRRQEDHWWECYVLQRLPMIELDRNRPAAAAKHCQDLLTIATNMGEGSEAPFARALMKLAAYQLQQTGPEALDRELETLRRIDSKWMIAYLQTVAADFELNNGNEASAQNRARDAFEVASLVSRHSEMVWAGSILIQSLFRNGNNKEAKKLLNMLQQKLSQPHNLSARSSKAFRETIRFCNVTN
jgi:tetratricopeptide (TPR) repeat protein